MKKLLLLFIPLVFFFSCEKDNPDANVANSNNQSNNNNDCHCGEAVNIVSYDGFNGSLVPDVNDSDADGDSTDFVIEGIIPAYEYTEIENNCTGDTMTICEILEIGETFCSTTLQGDDYYCECMWGSPIEMPCMAEIIDDNGDFVMLDVIIVLGYEFFESTNQQMATSNVPLADECVDDGPIGTFITDLSGN